MVFEVCSFLVCLFMKIEDQTECISIGHSTTIKNLKFVNWRDESLEV